ncbi:MAG: hypothetical protein IKE25_04210, partial [Clostridia bacterium]|nr:hypothetical protein [Clostridia bacterium]
IVDGNAGVWSIWITAGVTWVLAGVSCLLRYHSWLKQQGTAVQKELHPSKGAGFIKKQPAG